MTDLEKLFSCVDAFADAMKRKLKKKADMGYYGWDEEENYNEIMEKLVRHTIDQNFSIDASEEVDIGNLAMMIWNLNGRL
jgi:hypothetical protein